MPHMWVTVWIKEMVKFLLKDNPFSLNGIPDRSRYAWHCMVMIRMGEDTTVGQRIIL